MKKIISVILLVIILLLLSCFTVFADTQEANEKAEILKEIGLFKGTDEGFELDRKPTRLETIIMLIRLLGKENEALETTATHPFKDVATWSDKYVAYAYSKGLTNGISEDEFGPNNIANSNTYLTLVLRALGYSDTNNKDFSWINPYDLSKEVGILDENINKENFYRSDVALVSYNALTSNIKSTTKTLYSKLKEDKVITNTFIDINLKDTEKGNIIPTTQTNLYKEKEKIQIIATPADFVNKIEYFWDENENKIEIDAQTKTIYIPSNFESGSEHILYVRAKDIDGQYINWKMYKFKISKSSEVNIELKQGSTTLSTSKTYKYEMGTQLKINASPDSIKQIQYYWDEYGVSNKKTVEGNTKTIYIPSDFDENEEYNLYIRVLDENDDYSEWKKYTIIIDDSEKSENEKVEITVKKSTKVLSTNTTNKYPVGTSLRITASPSSNISKVQYYWEDYGSSSKVTANTYYNTITIPEEFIDGYIYILKVRAQDKSGTYTNWVNYEIEISDEEETADGTTSLTLSVKKGTTTLSTSKIYKYEMGTALKISTSSSTKTDCIEYYWSDNGSNSKKTVESDEVNIEIPKEFTEGEKYKLYVRAKDTDGDYTDWYEYSFEIPSTNEFIFVIKKGVEVIDESIVNEVQKDDSIKIQVTPSSKISSIQYYWSTTTSTKATTISSYTTTIKIPTAFTIGQEYTLYVRAKDTDGNYTNWYEYKFEVIVKIESFKLNKTELNLIIGQEETLTAIITPTDATYKKISWVSLDTSIATVDEDGKVTAIKAGEAKIIAITENDITKTCTVTVTEK